MFFKGWAVKLEAKSDLEPRLAQVQILCSNHYSVWLIQNICYNETENDLVGYMSYDGGMRERDQIRHGVTTIH
jgi:hypothetical protein